MTPEPKDYNIDTKREVTKVALTFAAQGWYCSKCGRRFLFCTVACFSCPYDSIITIGPRIPVSKLKKEMK